MSIDKKKIGAWLKTNFALSGKSYTKRNAQSAQKPISGHSPKEVEIKETSKRNADISNEPRLPSNPVKRDSAKEFMNLFEQLTYRRSPLEVWSDFITVSACSISNVLDKSHYDEREELYLKIIKKYVKKEREIFPKILAETVTALDINPKQDFLGQMFMKLNLGNRNSGQFFTPYHVSELMAKLILDDVVSQVKEKGYISINDPCCGGGAMLIAGINESKKQLEKAGLNFQNHLMIVGQDVDYTVALMCYIQISLLGAAGYVKIGNSLTEPVCANDTMENYWFTPMYYSDVWAMRRLFRGEKM